MKKQSIAILFTILMLPFYFLSAETKNTTNLETAIVAGGCFWCIEADFEKLNGVEDVISGYIGGHVKNPTYKQVSSGLSGHIEAIKITYNPTLVSYSQILDHFWKNIDPTRNDGQFCDYGKQYRPAIFYLDSHQKSKALKSIEKTTANKPFTDPLKVELIQAGTFYLAESYHQDYYKKNPIRYRFYRYNCGRDDRIKELWKNNHKK